MKRRALRKDQIAALDSLASDPRNTLIVASGRAREEIEATFSSLSRAVGLAAEHGYYLRPPVKKGQLGGGERLTPLRSPARPGADSSAGLAAPQPEGEGEGEGEAVAQSGMSEGLTRSAPQSARVPQLNSLSTSMPVAMPADKGKGAALAWLGWPEGGRGGRGGRGHRALALALALALAGRAGVGGRP